MYGSGLGLQLRYELSLLAKRHNTPAPQPELIELPECDERTCILSGLAVTPDIDLERCRFQNRSLSFFEWQLPPLCLHHQPGAVGRITHLAWSQRGLEVSAETSDRTAMSCGGFSVAVTVKSFVIHHADRPDYFADVTGFIEEISLVTRPANPATCVWERMPKPPFDQWYDLQIKRIRLLQQMVRHMGVAT